MKKVLYKFLVIVSIIMIFLPFNIKTVHASTSFTTCTLSEGSYLRSEPGGTKLKDVDGLTFLLYSPRRLEVLETRTVNGKEYKRVSTNYYSNNYTGWIYSGYLTDFKTYTIDENYGNQLRNAGFPESYILPLQKLHAIYPNWNFVASKLGNGIDFNEAVSNEYSPVYKNLINSKDTSLLSTDGSAYNNGVYKEFESGWYAPSRQTIAFYMDPRNWLTDSTIFMFEQLSYNQNLHTSQSVQQILNNTFMSGSYNYNGRNITYADTFVEVGKEKNVSPIHLASRVIQEQGPKGSSTINMNGGDGQTYYNHFNINANGSTTSQIISNALNTAKKNGWNNPYLSIKGGASTISNGYNNVGQDTIYYQKFNTINSNSLYWNQYMANVRVLPSESWSIFKSYYNSGVLNSSFTFKIPVYNNMPEKTTLSTTENADNTLKSLSISGCDINPSFNSTVTSYTCNVSSSTSQVTIDASKTSEYSSMTGNGVVKLSNNTTTTNIVVTAANGEKKTYTITINKINPGKESPSDIISYLGYNNSNNNISGINLGTDISNIISNVKDKFPLATIEIKNKNNLSKTTGKTATGDKITISNNGITTTFSIVMKGDVNSDGSIDISDLAMVKAKMLNKITLSGEYYKASDVNVDGNIDISDLAMIKAHMLGKINITK